jgi:hypothetical protein
MMRIVIAGMHLSLRSNEAAVCGLACHASLWCERKRPERSAGWYRSQPRVAGEQRIDPAIAASHVDVLHAILVPGDRLTFDAGACLELPQLLPSIGVKGFELAGQLPGGVAAESFNSSAASLVIEAVIRVPPTSIPTCVAVVPFLHRRFCL